MGREVSRPRCGVVASALVATFAALVLQSVLHLELVLSRHHVDTILDLDRSNGVPDIVSTIALAAAAAGAAALARRSRALRRATCVSLAALLAFLTVADALHDGAHPTRPHGMLVMGLVFATGALLFVLAVDSDRESRAILAVAFIALARAFLVSGLDRYNQWFERERGDPVREYQIVAKEGLELLGWALVAVALWSEALRPRVSSELPTERASRGPAAPRRRAA
jgi:hypothetical protein